jgi:hypothetical protein
MALHVHNTEAPIVIESLKAVQIKSEFAPSDTAHEGTHQILPAETSLDNMILVLAAVVNAPVILKTYDQLPLNVTPVVIDAAAEIQ